MGIYRRLRIRVLRQYRIWLHLDYCESALGRHQEVSR